MLTEADTMRDEAGARELERRILNGLMAEWQHAAAALRHDYRYTLRLPGFELRDIEQALGQWVPDKRLIVLGRRTVLDHPWLTVRDILLHEMAHQLCSEVLGDVTSHHGPTFHKACQWLGARPDAMARALPELDRIAEHELPAHDRILLKVKKLLAMAQSANRHEAELAMAKAHEFIARYNVDLLTAHPARTYDSVCLGAPAIRHSTDAYVLSSLLRDFYFVRTIWIQAYVLEKDRMGKVLEISGTPENIKMAGYVHAFLIRSIHDQWQTFCKGHRLPARLKTDFALGLLSGFQDTLRQQEKQWEQENGSTYALIRQGDARLTEYVDTRYPRLRTLSGRGKNVDQDIHAAGVEAGRKTVLSKPVESNTGGRRLMIDSSSQSG